MMRLSGEQLRVGRRCLTRHLNQASQDHLTSKASLLEGTKIRISKVAQKNGRTTQTIVSACKKKPHPRNHGRLGRNRKWTSENPQNDAAAKAAQFGNQWSVVHTTVVGSNTIPTR